MFSLFSLAGRYLCECPETAGGLAHKKKTLSQFVMLRFGTEVPSWKIGPGQTRVGGRGRCDYQEGVSRAEI